MTNPLNNDPVTPLILTNFPDNPEPKNLSKLPNRFSSPPRTLLPIDPMNQSNFPALFPSPTNPDLLKTKNIKPVRDSLGMPTGDLFLSLIPIDGKKRLPLDTSADPYLSAKKPNTRQGPPPTPRRAKTAINFPTCTKKAIELNELGPDELGQALSKHEKTTFTFVKHLGAGDYVNAYLFESNKKPVVVKVPHFKKIQPNNGLLTVFSELTNYLRIKQKEFPVAVHYNFDTLLQSNSRIEARITEIYKNLEQLEKASIELKRNLRENIREIKEELKDDLRLIFEDGYYLVEYVEEPYTLPSSEEEVIKQMCDEASLLHQLKQMFSRAFEEKMPVDLSPDNVRLKAGRLILCDLYPFDEYGTDENPFFILIQHSIDSFRKKLTLSEDTRNKFQQFLDPRVE